jgi:hypothetical protein
VPSSSSPSRNPSRRASPSRRTATSRRTSTWRSPATSTRRPSTSTPSSGSTRTARPTPTATPTALKAGPLSELEAGDYVFFYATLSTAGDDPPGWQAPEWGAYVVGQFRLAADPVTEFDALDGGDRARFASNAHLKRETFDAAILLRGDPRQSALYDAAVPLSARRAGAEANRLVADLSADSGKGPWWRRPLRFDADATGTLLGIRASRDLDPCFGD